MDESKKIPTAGLLVLRRVNYFTEAPYKSSERTPAVTLTHDELLKCYRGIEGNHWPDALGLEKISLHGGLAQFDQYGAVSDYFRNARTNLLCDLIYIRFLKTTVEEVPHGDFFFCGYDFGFYSSPFNSYSAVFHEIIYGRHSELRNFSKLLNEHLLVPTLEDIDKIEQERVQLIRGGADLETDDNYEGFSPISIYGWNQLHTLTSR
jgi:hypothetical protein